MRRRSVETLACVVILCLSLVGLVMVGVAVVTPDAEPVRSCVIE